MCEKSEQFHCPTDSKYNSSSSNKLLTPTGSTLLGARALVPTSCSVSAMLARQLRRWQACRRRRKRRKNVKEEQNKCSNKSGKTATRSSRSCIEKRSRGIRVISSHASDSVSNSHSKENSASIGMATTESLLLAADYSSNGSLLARNSDCLAPAAKGVQKIAALVKMAECTSPQSLIGVCTAAKITTIKEKTTTASLTRSMSKSMKDKRLSNKRRAGVVVAPAMRNEKQQQQRQLVSAAFNDLQSAFPEEEEQQQKPKLQQFPAVNPLQVRLQAEADARQTYFLGMQYSSEHETHELKQQQQQPTQQHCLPARAASSACVQHRSWRNLISCVLRGPHAKTRATTTTVMSNIAVASTTATQIKTKPSCTASVESNSALAKAPTEAAHATKNIIKTTTNATATLTIMPSQLEHVPFVVAPRKSKCRRTFALTSALTTTTTTTPTTTPTTMTKKPTVIKATNTTTRMSKTKAPLARNRTFTKFFGDILTLLVGALTLHAAVLRCLLITTLTATIASVTAAPSVSQNSMLLLPQQTLQQHFHNSSHNSNFNNNNNINININTLHNSSSSSSSDISTFTFASAHNYNHRHSQLPPATFAPLTPPPTPVRMMDIVVLNGSTSSNTNTLKSLSSIRAAAMEGVQMGDLNQLPIFDFGLPRNITARTGQAEAAIKCRVERLDDKSVSWIRKRDLHILTVATATYTSDKRFQVTSSKDGREWILHVKSPQARDSGIYECQVNTEPKMSMAFQLNIIEIPADSRAIISGPADLHFKVGSAIILNCHVQQPSIRDIGPIYWYRGDHIITPFELDDDEADNNAHATADADDAVAVESNDSNGRMNAFAEGTTLHKRQPSSLANNEVEVDVTATITNVNALAAAGSRSSSSSNSRKGSTGRNRAAVTVAAATQHDGLTNDITAEFTARIAMESQLGDTMKSRLRISNAQTTDTGNYTCQPTTASSASVMVHVINDENPAAMQKSSASSVRVAAGWGSKGRSVLLPMLLFVAVTIIKTMMTRANIITTTIAVTAAESEAEAAMNAKTITTTAQIFDCQSQFKSMEEAVNCQQQQDLLEQ